MIHRIPPALRGGPMAAACAAALALATLAGCGARQDTLAKVGDETITVDEFQDVARASGTQYTAPADSAKRMLLNDLVQRALLVQEARSRHLVPDSTIARARAQLEDQVGTQALLERLVPGDVPVSDAEVQALYRERATETHGHFVYAMDKSTADAALRAIQHGEAFDSVASRVNPRGTLGPGGDAGFLTPGQLMDPLDRMVTESPVGKVVGPVEAPQQGWFLLRVVERRPHHQAPLEQERETLVNLIRRRKQRVLATKAFQDLRSQYHVTVEPGAPQAMFQRANSPRTANADPHLVLARYDGENGKRVAYTMGDAEAELPNAPDRPNFQMVPEIQRWIDTQALRKAMAIEARRRHLIEEPKVARQVRERLNNLYLNTIYSSQILAHSEDVTPEDVRAAWQRRADQFIRLDDVTLLAVQFPDSATAARVLEHAGHGGTLRDVAAMAAPGAKVAEQVVRFPNADPLWQRMEPTFMGMQPGQYQGPLHLANGWMVMQVQSKHQGTQDYDKLPPVIQQQLRNDAVELKRDARLTQLTDQLRLKFTPRLYPDRLKKIPWPVPPAPAAAG